MTVFVQSPEEEKVPGRLWLLLAQLLFCLMLVFPTMDRFVYPKQALVLVLLGAVLFSTSAGFKLHSKTVIWTLAMVGVSLLFVIRGLFLSAPGALSDTRLYVAWPLVYLLLVGGINMRVLKALERSLVVSTFCIAIFVGAFYLAMVKLIPAIPLDVVFSQDELVGQRSALAVQEGHVEMGLAPLDDLEFLVPFVIAAVICRNSEKFWVRRTWLVLSLLLILPLVILSGRRALQLVTMCTPFLTLIFGLFQPRKEKRQLLKSLGVTALAVVLVLVSLIPVLGAASGVTFEGVKERFTSGFDFSASNRSDSAVGRVDQYMALMEGWRQSPFLGKGLGASAHKSIRDPKGGWGYELTYVDFLFETGILGCAAYAAGFLWLFWSGIRIIRSGGIGSRFMIPVLVGFTCYLIANGTNPKMNYFDGLWSVFLVLAFINYWLLSHERNSSISSTGASAGA